MAYSKQTWTDDVSAVTGARMTHIEQGIYDNSLGIDKINPSGTATTTAEIEEGQITDVIGFKSLKLKGQTSQYTTTGKNKLSLTIENKTAGGITLTRNNDNSYKISGTSTSLLLFTSSNTQTLTANTTYTLGITNGNNNVQLSLRTSDGNTQYVKTEGTATYATFTPTTDIEVKLYVRIPSGVTVNETIFPIVVEGSTIGTYEPYTGGKASPNPDFPQDVQVVRGNNKITISNRNLAEGWEQGDINAYTGVENTDVHTIKLTNYIPYDRTKTYKFSVNGNVPSNSASLRFYNKNKEYIGYAQLYASTGGSDFTPTIATNVADTTPRYFRIRISDIVATLSDNVLVTNSSDISYIEHQGNNFDIDLPVENIINMADFTTTVQGVTITKNGDIIEINGTASADNTFQFNPIRQKTFSGDFTLSATYIGGKKTGNANFNIRDYQSGTALGFSTNLTTSNTSRTNTIDNKSIKYGIYVASGAIFDGYKIKIQLEPGKQSHNYTPYGVTPIWLGKINTYSNDIRRYNGKWFWHKEADRIKFNGSEAWNYSSGNVVFYTDVISTLARIGTRFYCDRFRWISNTTAFTDMNDGEAKFQDNTTSKRLIFKDLAHTDVSTFKTWLASNNMTLDYVLATPIDEEITYTPLIRQLDELYNSGLYNETNISQDNSSEAFILDLEACKNNINGIVEYIRR